MSDLRTPDELTAENESICSKLLGWERRANVGTADGRAIWWHHPATTVGTPTPSFTTWAEAGLILDALQANHMRSLSLLISLSKILKGGLLEPADVRAAALAYIRSLP